MSRRIVAATICALVIFIAGCAAKDDAVDATIQEQLGLDPDSEILVLSQSTPSITQYDILPAPTPLHTASPSPTPQGTATTPKPSTTPKPVKTPAYDLTKVNSENGYVKGHDVNMREGPGTQYKITGKVSYHVKVVITGKTDTWYRIKADGKTGFMLKEFIGVGNIPTPTPEPTPTPKSQKTTKPQIKQGEKGEYTNDEVYLVAKLIYAEGKNQSTESFLAMANVLYNRVNSRKFGGTVEKEVYRNGQFSVVEYDSFASLKPSSAAKNAVRDVFIHGKRVLPDGVMFFRSASKGEKWGSSRKFYMRFGGNNYYY